MNNSKFAFAAVALIATVFLGTTSVGRADIPGWFWPTLFNWADGVTAEVDALEARVATLEAENPGFNSGDLTGLAYCVHGNGRELTGGADPGVYRSNYVGTLSFTSSSGGLFLTVRDADAFLNTNTGVISGAVELPFSVENMTYTVFGTGVTISVVGEDDILLHVSPDGNFMYGTVSDFSGNNHDFDSIMAIRSTAC
ncbi:MAG: hypothetical protein ACR2P6_10985 [Gammaproteobacteria bacterium]